MEEPNSVDQPDETRASAAARRTSPSTRKRQPRKAAPAAAPEPQFEDDARFEDGAEMEPEPEPDFEWEPPAATEERSRPLTGLAARVAHVPRRIVAVIAVVVVAVLLGSLIFSLLRISDQNSTNSLRSGALKAGNTYGVWLSSYDYRNLNAPTAPWAEVESHSTAKFKSDFQNTSSTLRSVLTRYSATAQGKIIAEGLQSVSGSHAVILLFIDQTVTNSVQKPNSVTQPLRVQLTLARAHGKWLIDNLEVPK